MKNVYYTFWIRATGQSPAQVVNYFKFNSLAICGQENVFDLDPSEILFFNFTRYSGTTSFLQTPIDVATLFRTDSIPQCPVIKYELYKRAIVNDTETFELYADKNDIYISSANKLHVNTSSLRNENYQIKASTWAGKFALKPITVQVVCGYHRIEYNEVAP